MSLKREAREQVDNQFLSEDSRKLLTVIGRSWKTERGMGQTETERQRLRERRE